LRRAGGRNHASFAPRGPRQSRRTTVEVFGQGAVLLYYRVAQQQPTIQIVELLWLG
jgi:hypothetical protein